MKLLRYLISMFLFLVLGIGIFVSYIIAWDIVNMSFFSFFNIFLIVLIQFLIIRGVFYLFYDKPILVLEYTIKKFLVGSLRDEEISFKKTINPHLNYVLFFFRKTLSTLKNIKSEFIHGKEIKSEVDFAAEIQEKLFHKTIPVVPHLEIVARSKPAAEIGWDSFDIIPQWDNYYIYVGDATGHGVGAWFIMMMVNALVSGFSIVSHKWNQILALTNDIIKPRVKANLLMSMLLIRWNAEEKRLYMTGAWHEYLMIYKNKSNKCFKIKSGWVALGMTKNIHKLLKEREISFEENDIIILYSDGITEAINQSKRDGNETMFGEDRLIEAIEKAPEIGTMRLKTARSVFKNISISLSQFMWYKHLQLDDITLVTIQYVSDRYKKDEDCSEMMSDELITDWQWNK